MKICEHMNRKDLAHGIGEDRHFFCPDCKAHWYKGDFYTKDRWNKWINEPADCLQEAKDVISQLLYSVKEGDQSEFDNCIGSAIKHQEKYN